MESTIRESVVRVIVEQLGVKTEEVTDEANISTDLGADSLDTVELVMSLEEEFGIDLPENDDTYANFKTVGDVINLVDTLVAKKLS